MATMVQALRMALHYGEENLGLKEVFGEDVGPPLGGAFTATQGVKSSWNSPLDERGIVGAAIGLGLAQRRCVAEVQFADYIYNTIDLLKLGGMQTWSSNGDWKCPMTIMTPTGSGIRGSIYHSHSFDAMMTHIPGWKIVMPSTPIDAYGLMMACLKEENPTMYLVPKALMRVRGEEPIPGEPELTPEGEKELKAMVDKPIGVDGNNWKPRWPKGLTDYTVELGKAKVVREGDQVTVVSYGRTMLVARQAADMLREEGISVEVIDLRTLWPYDWETIKSSILKTNRCIFVNEDTEVTNFGEHFIRRVVEDEELFYRLEARPLLVAGKHVPGVGMADTLEMAIQPQLNHVVDAIRASVAERA